MVEPTALSSRAAPIAWIDWVLATTRRRLAAAFASYLGLTLFWLAPVAFHPSTRILTGPSDLAFTVRGQWAASAQGTNPFTLSHDYFNGAPEGIPILSAANWVAPIQPATTWLLRYAIGGTAALNLFLLAGFVLTGFFGFMLFDRIGFHPLASLLGGYVLAFNPWCIERARAGHVGFLHLWVLLLLVIALLSLSERRTLRSAALVGLAYGGTFLMSSYMGFLATLIVGVYLVYELIRVRGASERLWTATLTCVGGAVVVALQLPGLIAYLVDRGAAAGTLSNPVEQASRFAAKPLAYVLPSHRHPVLGSLAQSAPDILDLADNPLFFGYTTMLLALAGIVMVVQARPATLLPPGRRRALVLATATLPLAVWFSLPSTFHILGVRVVSPSYAVVHITTYYRVYARFGIVAGLMLVILAAFSLDRLVRRPGFGLPVGLVATALIVFELLPGRMTTWPANEPPPWDRWLAAQPAGIVAHYPLPTDKRPALDLEGREIYYQMFSHKPIFNLVGSGIGHTREDAIRILTRYATDPLTPGILAAEHVRYVVVHDDVYRDQGEAAPVLSETFEPVGTFGSARVFRLAEGVQPVDVDSTLEQNAAAIAAVQGLVAPSLELGPGFQPASAAAPDQPPFRVDRRGVVIVKNSDPNLRRAQIILVAAADEATARIRLVDGDDRALGVATVGSDPTQVILGPFPLRQGTENLFVETIGGRQTVTITSLSVQPLSDFTTSLRAQ